MFMVLPENMVLQNLLVDYDVPLSDSHTLGYTPFSDSAKSMKAMESHFFYGKIIQDHHLLQFATGKIRKSWQVLPNRRKANTELPYPVARRKIHGEHDHYPATEYCKRWFGWTNR
jgi:hypothetical protein